MYTRSKKANKSLTSKLLIIFYASCWYFNMYFVVYFWKYDNVNRTLPHSAALLVPATKQQIPRRKILQDVQNCDP